MKPYYQDAAVALYIGDCLDVLATLPAESVDACVTDPPYELGFMGKTWDCTGIAFQPETWAAVSRVLKPGAYLLACGGTRTYHRMTCAIEDAGFEIRDCLAWLYGSGFPKSLNLGDGRGTAIKPAHEPIVLARKPFTGTVKANVEKFGTGALNIDATRIRPTSQDGFRSSDDGSNGDTSPWLAASQICRNASNQPGVWSDAEHARLASQIASAPFGEGYEMVGDGSPLGRWPANVCLDEIAALVLDEQSGELTSGDYSGERSSDKTLNIYGTFAGTRSEAGHRGDSGGASRFFYTAKPSREERDYGCEGLVKRSGNYVTGRTPDSAGAKHARAGTTQAMRGNVHPTVKPVELMRWLVKLVTPASGLVLDPFLGSGTTGMACRYEHRRFIGIEREADYMTIADQRIRAVAPLFAQESTS